MKRSFSGIYSICVVLAGCLWGTTGLFIHQLGAAGLSSMQISELRAAITAVVMLAVTLCVNPSLLRIRWRDLWCFFGTGVCSVLVFNYCYFHTIRESGMAVAATLLYTSPVFVMLLSLWLFGEAFTLRKVVSLGLTVAGCVLVSGILSGGGGLTAKGMALGIGAGLGYALYSIFSRYAIQRGYHSLTITTYTFIFAAVGGVFLTDFEEIGAASAAGSSLWLLLVVYAVVTTVSPYLLYTIGLQRVENSKAAVMAAVEPVCATLLEIFVVRKLPGAAAAIGILLVLSAILVLNVSVHKTNTSTGLPHS